MTVEELQQLVVEAVHGRCPWGVVADAFEELRDTYWPERIRKTMACTCAMPDRSWYMRQLATDLHYWVGAAPLWRRCTETCMTIRDGRVEGGDRVE